MNAVALLWLLVVPPYLLSDFGVVMCVLVIVLVKAQTTARTTVDYIAVTDVILKMHEFMDRVALQLLLFDLGVVMSGFVIFAGKEHATARTTEDYFSFRDGIVKMNEFTEFRFALFFLFSELFVEMSAFIIGPGPVK